MEATGGPKSQAGAMLYHQYKQQKKQLEGARQLGKGQLQSDIMEKILKCSSLNAASKSYRTASDRKACLGNHDQNTGALGRLSVERITGDMPSRPFVIFGNL
jgi:hypothetical protein